MNIVIIKGRLARDPENRTTKNGLSFARFTVAVDGYTKKGEDKKVDFLSCMAWGKTAEFIGKFFTKGKEIAGEGRIQTGSYTTESGEKRYTTDIVLDRVEFCGSKDKAETTADDVPFF